MITIEYLGRENSRNDILAEVPLNIYKDKRILAHISTEFASVAFKVLEDELSKGDTFKIRIIDKNKSVLKETYNEFISIYKTSLYYNELNNNKLEN